MLHTSSSKPILQTIYICSELTPSRALISLGFLFCSEREIRQTQQTCSRCLLILVSLLWALYSIIAISSDQEHSLLSSWPWRIDCTIVHINWKYNPYPTLRMSFPQKVFEYLLMNHSKHLFLCPAKTNQINERRDFKGRVWREKTSWLVHEEKRMIEQQVCYTAIGTQFVRKFAKCMLGYPRKQNTHISERNRDKEGKGGWDREEMSNNIWWQTEGKEILELVMLPKMATLNDGREFQRSYKKGKMNTCMLICFLFGT